MATTNDLPIVVDHVVGPHGSLAVRLASAELRLVGSDGDRVVIRTADGRGLPDGVIVETHDGIASLREKHGISLSFGRGRRTIELEIAAPRGAEVTADIASGSIEAEALTGAQTYRTASGEIRLRRAAGRIELSTVSGDASIGLDGTADLAIKSISGDVRVDGGRLDALRVQTTSGDVRVDSPLVGRTGNAIETLSGDVDLVVGAGIRVEARTVSGDLASDLPHRSDGRMGRRTLVVGDGEIELMFRSVSGDLRVHGAASGMPAPVTPPAPPAPPTPLTPSVPRHVTPAAMPTATWSDERADPTHATRVTDDEAYIDEPLDVERMEILRALERGELDVSTAMDRLAAVETATSTGGDGTDA